MTVFPCAGRSFWFETTILGEVLITAMNNIGLFFNCERTKTYNAVKKWTSGCVNSWWQTFMWMDIYCWLTRMYIYGPHLSSRVIFGPPFSWTTQVPPCPISLTLPATAFNSHFHHSYATYCIISHSIREDPFSYKQPFFNFQCTNLYDRVTICGFKIFSVLQSYSSPFYL